MDARAAAALFCVDPLGTGGVALRANAGAQRDAWMQWMAALLPAETVVRRVPLHIRDERLLGGLDLAATLAAGRPVAQRGLLAEADGGVLVLAMAERLSAGTAARIAAVLDTHEVAMARDGLEARAPGRIGVVALDEGIADDEHMPAPLRDRLAFHVVLVPPDRDTPGADGPAWTRDDIAAARARLAQVRVDPALHEALCATALALGIDSLRAVLLALRAARASAALRGRCLVDDDDARLAARLVLAPRATRLPPGAEAEAEPQAEPEAEAADGPGDPPPPPPTKGDAAEPTAADGAALQETVLEAALAAMPRGLLDALRLGRTGDARTRSAAGSGADRAGGLRGRPGGVRRGELRGRVRLNLIETLRAAAPWQPLRRRAAGDGAGIARIQVRREDFHVTHYRQRIETTTVFVVDASGSSALNRLAEAKGAVELLLADCYVRRDSVALIAFRGRSAELLLPPTRSLVRAKRSLAGLPGGGGTPLAAGIDAALALADATRRRGRTPVTVLLTDGRANIASDGTPGRQRACEDALHAARRMRALGVTSLWLDTSPQPQPEARELAAEMGATYLPLPHADATALSQAVRSACP